jgi:tRNA threonylcarbamoyladenosine biosynthesis protein TsaE
VRRLARWALAFALAPSAALAHPHVLIDSHAVVQFDKGKVVALVMGWKFDPVYSSTLVHDYDADKNGSLSPAEIAAMEREAFQDTAKTSYFTYARVDGQPVTWPKATDFKVMTFKDSLVYSFRLELPAPVDPRKQALRFSTYEESYYIDIDFPNGGAVTLTGDGASGCAAKMSPDFENKLYGGIVVPKKVEILCEP